MVAAVIASPSQQPAAATESAILKEDVVLTRDRTEPSKREEVELANALRNLERQETLFQKGLVSQAQLDRARQEVALLQAEQENRARVEKVSQLPYSLLVSPGQRTSLRVSVNVPVGQATTTTDGVTTSERRYHLTGTNIDCIANAVADGGYRLQLTVEDTSIVPSERLVAAGGPRVSDVAFRTLSVSNTLVLRDGQMLPFVVGTDRITGETLRAEVRLTVLK
jgi:hypothetical protein